MWHTPLFPPAPVQYCKQQTRVTCLWPGQQILECSHATFDIELGGGGEEEEEE